MNNKDHSAFPASTISTIDKILNRIYQLLTQEFELHGPWRRRHQEQSTVARLAIDLARLHETKSPGQHLAEAVQLLTNAGAAIQYERKRPERVDAAIHKQTIEMLEISRKQDEVPWDSIVREKDAPKSKAPYTERGFRKLLKKYVAEQCDLASNEIRKALMQKPPNYERAESIVYQCWNTPQEVPRFLMLCREVKNSEGVRNFIQRWRDYSEPGAFRYLFDEAKAGRFSRVTLAAIYQTRDRMNRAKTKRATAAARAKRRKSRHD